MSDDELQLRAQGRVGTILGGKYRIDSVLGVGGMAVVYAATHRNQKRVAIKVLHPELSMRSELRARFFREGYAANTVDHPGAVAVLDDDTAEDGAAFLVMEQLEGDEVERIWEKHGNRLDARVVLSIADALLAVLVAAHAKSIIHRDIKPANLYITRDGTLKVLDFGIARVRDAASGVDGPSATKTGLMMGTPTYMAPEQALGKSAEIDGTTDLWSVGATLFTLLSGHLVHQGESMTAIIVQAATQPARSLAVVAPGVDPRLAEVVDRALSFEKAGRWPDAATMRAAVRNAHLGMFGVPVSKEPLELLFGDPVANASTMLAMPAAAPTPPPAPMPSFASAPSFPPAPPQANRGSLPSMPSSPGAHAPQAGITAAPSAPPAAVMPVYPYAVSSDPGATQVPQKDSRRLIGVLVGVAILTCAGTGYEAWRVLGPPADTQPVASAVGSVSSAPSAAPSPTQTPRVEPAEPADSGDGDDGDAGDTVDGAASSDGPSASAPAPSQTARGPLPRPLATLIVPTVRTPPATPPPVPPPPPPPVAAPPPQVCRSQCSDIARSCKTRCKAAYHLGHERHGCLVDCESVERDCKGRAPC